MEPKEDWFGNPINASATPMPDKKTNPCIVPYGQGPPGQICANCMHLFGICKSRIYYKCDLRENTRGATTDHRLRWPACGRFILREGPLRLFDGRG